MLEVLLLAVDGLNVMKDVAHPLALGETLEITWQ